MEPEDISLIMELRRLTSFAITEEEAKTIAGKWAAEKVRKRQRRASASGLWDQYYLLGDLAEGLERGIL